MDASLGTTWNLANWPVDRQCIQNTLPFSTQNNSNSSNTIAIANVAVLFKVKLLQLTLFVHILIEVLAYRTFGTDLGKHQTDLGATLVGVRR